MFHWGKDRLDGQAPGEVVNGVTDSWRPVMTGVLQGSLLGTDLSNVFINNMDKGIRSTLSEFTDDTVLEEKC